MKLRKIMALIGRKCNELIKTIYVRRKREDGLRPAFFFLRCYPGLVPGSVSRFVKMVIILFIL